MDVRLLLQQQPHRPALSFVADLRLLLLLLLLLATQTGTEQEQEQEDDRTDRSVGWSPLPPQSID